MKNLKKVVVSFEIEIEEDMIKRFDEMIKNCDYKDFDEVVKSEVELMISDCDEVGGILNY